MRQEAGSGLRLVVFPARAFLILISNVALQTWVQMAAFATMTRTAQAVPLRRAFQVRARPKICPRSLKNTRMWAIGSRFTSALFM